MTIGVFKAHVKRLFSEDQSAWVDLLRFDMVFGRAAFTRIGGQGAQFELKWSGTGPDGYNALRVFEDLILYSPTATQTEINDGTARQIKIKITKSLQMKGGPTGSARTWTFNNKEDNVGRVATVKRVPYVKLPDTVDPSTPMDWNDYLPFLNAGIKDDTNYVDLEFPTSYYRNTTDDHQRDHYVFKNDAISGRFLPPPGDALNLVYRLDPWQVIVNINWGNPVDIMHLVDCTGSYAVESQISRIRKYADAIYQKYPGARQGMGTFMDFPFAPYGEAESGDYVYALNYPLVDRKHANNATWHVPEGYGMDDPESQYDAMNRVVLDQLVGWKLKQNPSIVICHTDTISHYYGDPFNTQPNTTHIHIAEFQLTYLTNWVYGIYVGNASFALAGLSGEDIPEFAPTNQQILDAIDRGIKWWNDQKAAAEAAAA